jgi:D-alanine-D-alanine ligase
MGVSTESIVYTVLELREQIDKQLRRYDQPILCEHYVKGREVTIGMIGNLAPNAARRLNERTAPHILPDSLTFLPPLEVDVEAHASEAGVYTSRLKVDMADEFRYMCPAPLEPKQERQMCMLAAAVFRVMGCKDVARVDFRLDAANEDSPYILEVNPLPGLNPGYSDLCLEANAAGWSHERLINTIVDLAAARQGLEVSGTTVG